MKLLSFNNQLEGDCIPDAWLSMGDIVQHRTLRPIGWYVAFRIPTPYWVVRNNYATDMWESGLLEYSLIFRHDNLDEHPLVDLVERVPAIPNLRIYAGTRIWKVKRVLRRICLNTIGNYNIHRWIDT